MAETGDLVTGVRQGLARARAAARAQLAAAQERLRAAEARQAATARAAERLPGRAATVRDARLRDVDARHAAAIA